ncbi:MAG: Ig-like domain-containing protein [Micrococcales bacterium]|nr:Ig-like domain-containing protein [Micrococcales bacterium]
MPNTTRRRRLLPISAFTAFTLLAGGGLLSPATGISDVFVVQHGGTVPTPGSGPAAGGTTVTGAVAPSVEFTAIAASYYSGYGLDEAGNVWAWGAGQYGQLGNGTKTHSRRPVRVQAATGTLPRFTAIAAGYETGYALDERGNVWAWGLNDEGQLGNGTRADSSRPVQVQAATGTLPVFTTIAAGRETGYALDASGGVWAWGYNSQGQLGNGTRGNATNSTRPVRVQAATGTLPKFTAIAAGDYTGYALDATGNVWSWGLGDDGQLGNGTSGYATNSTRPVRVQAATGTLPKFTAIAAGNSTGYALDETGSIWAWGDNYYGQLGNGTRADSSRPVRVQAATGTTLPVFTAIAAGTYTGYALDVDGNVWAWGDNHWGELGNGTSDTTAQPSRPGQVQAATGTLPVFTAIAAGWGTGYALDATGTVWAWGRNLYGALGNGTSGYASYSTRPVQVQATVESVAFGGVAGTGLSQDPGGWTVTTPAGCGPVDVTVRHNGADETASTVTYPGGFTFGSPPVFTTQPVSATVPPGGVFTATVELSGDPAPNVRWQALSEWGWVDVPGATSPVLTVNPTLSSTYRAIASNCWTDLDESAYTAYSDTATATAAPVSPSPSPSVSPSLPPHSAKATAVGLAMKKLTMKKNTTLKAVALAYPISLGAKLSWTSSSPKVAKVSPTGKIKALKPGRTVITAKAENGKLARLKVTVVAKEAKVKTVKVALKSVGVRASKSEKIVVKEGKVARLSVLPNPQGATLTKMPTFKSSKPKVASVDKTGLVTAKKKGKTKIKVTLAGKKTTLLIHVI